jgi:KTSC domain
MLLRNLVPINSSCVKAAGWSNGRLAIKFPSGKIKFFGPVPVTLWQELMAAESAGRFFNQRIKGQSGRQTARQEAQQ